MRQHLTSFGLSLFACMMCAAGAFASQATQPQTPAEAPQTKPAAAAVEYVLMDTSKGDIVIELNREKAPISVANFLSYVDDGFYNGTIFHRVMSNFMIQGGGMTEGLKEKPTKAPIKNEWQNGLKNMRGSIAMARTSQPDSATSQFFINVVDNAMLDQPRDGAAYAVFGKVVAGMDVVDAIRNVQTHTHPSGHQNVPVETVTIEKVTRLTPEQAKERMGSGAKPTE